ncbi:MAG TPA: hypothetical protein VLY03_07660 [Bacteroidota bacterium]|nr:hypothetical protein [Bacteroidota bacterium]
MRRTILLLLIVFLAGCGGGGDRVVAILKTQSYHTDRCAKVFMANTVRITRERAHELKLHPCPYCKPDAGL